MTIRTSVIAGAIAALALADARGAAHDALRKDVTVYSYDIDDSYDTHYEIAWIENVLESEEYRSVYSGYHSSGGSGNFWAHYYIKLGEGYQSY